VTDRLRAVLDINVFLSAFLSRNPSSPTREILQRFQDGEFVLLISYDVIDELFERLLKGAYTPYGSWSSWPCWISWRNGSRFQKRPCSPRFPAIRTTIPFWPVLSSEG
jgi:hypothetical protein